MKIEWNTRAYNWTFATSAVLGFLFFLERAPNRPLAILLGTFATAALTTSVLFWGGELLIRAGALLHQFVDAVSRQHASRRDGRSPRDSAKLVHH